VVATTTGPGVTVPPASDGPRIGLVYTASQAAILASGREDPLRSYRRAIEMHGGRVVSLLVSDPESVTNEKTRLLDGLLLPGGCDVDPELFGEDPHPRLERIDRALDSLQFFLLEFARKLRLPVLGICRGHQVINVFHGGSLYQDIPTQLVDVPPLIHRLKDDHGTHRAVHLIQIASGSEMEVLAGSSTWEVNTYHHQSVKQLGRDLRVTASSADGVVEAIEGTTDWFVLGVQFHPEKDLEHDPRCVALFARFVEAVRAHRAEEEAARARQKNRSEPPR
jgi:putative glutamine amidotransferase